MTFGWKTKSHPDLASKPEKSVKRVNSQFLWYYEFERKTARLPGSRAVACLGLQSANRLFLEKAELLIEAADPATAINQVLVTTGPGRVRGRIDVQLKIVAFLAPGRTGLER